MSPRRKPMRPARRQAEICELVARRGEVTVDSLAQKFDISPETIRRDLSLLDENGRVRKVHGGAKSVTFLGEGEFEARMRRNVLAKRLIAEKLVKEITPHQTLFMDTGSTTLFCAEALAHTRDLTIITNSTLVAAAFAKGRGDANIFLLGGRYRRDNAQTVGSEAIGQINAYHADRAILTVGALSTYGIMDYSSHEAQIARAMVKAASQVTIVADHTKVNQVASFKVCNLDDIQMLITDRISDQGLIDVLKKNRVAIR